MDHITCACACLDYEPHADFFICAQACQKSLSNFYDVFNLSIDRFTLDLQIDVYLVVFETWKVNQCCWKMETENGIKLNPKI